MQKIKLIPFSFKDDVVLLEKWLTNSDLMHGWGMAPFKKEEILPWVNDPTRVVLMIQDENNGNTVGFVNFYEWDREKAVASRGTLIDPQYQNLGYGRAAIEKSNKYAFEKMGLKRIELYVESDNERSKHLTEKLGYTLDRFDPIKGRYYYHMEKEGISTR